MRSIGRTFVLVGMGAIIVLVSMAGCDRGPGQRLVGQWVVDVTATRAHMQELMDEKGVEAGPERAMIEGLMAGLEHQRRTYNFRRNGTVRVTIRGPEGIVGGVTLNSSEAQWEVVDATADTLTVRLASDDAQLDGWQRTFHFDGDDRLHYRHEDSELRHYWRRSD